MTDGLTFELTAESKYRHRLVVFNGEVRFMDKLDIFSAASREKMTDRLHREFPAIDIKTFGTELNRLAVQESTRPKDKPTGRAAPIPPPDRVKLFGEMPKDVQDDALATLKNPELLAVILSDIARLGVTGEKKLAMTLYLCGTSRLLQKPFSCITQGPSTSGKSFIQDTVSKLFPPEAIFIATSITPNALYYLPDGSLSHRWIVAGERSRVEDDERAEATRALREMLTGGEITKLIPEKNKDGNLETRIIHQAGPIAFSETTTLSKFFDEDSNRCILLQTDEQESQTRRVLIATVASRAGKTDTKPTIARHHAIQRALEQLPVTIPYAEELATQFPASRTEARRAFGHLLSVIEAVALLHQFQRERQDGCIVATKFDYDVSRWLLAEPMGRLLGRALSPAAQRFYDRLKVRVSGSDTFTTREAGKGEPASGRAVSGWLRELADGGHVEIAEPSRGPKAATWKMIFDPDNTTDGAILPDLGAA